jgi:ABC-type bacteriocin/lantibiotic exporter with double-glycine peptidase domain
MKKRTVISALSVFVILVLSISVFSIFKSKETVKSKNVWVEKTINKEPMQTDADCGIVTVKMLLDFYGRDVSYADLKVDLNSTDEGTDWMNIKKYFSSLDNLTSLDFEKNIEKAKDYLEKGYPLFICWDVDGDPEWSHYSILIAIDESSVWMLDPLEKKSLSQYSLDYFLPCWEKEEYWFCILEESDKSIAKQKQLYKNTALISDDSLEQTSDSSEEFISMVNTK